MREYQMSNTVQPEPNETTQLLQIRGQYETERKNLGHQQARLSSEVERLYAVYSECHDLLFEKEFQSLSLRLEAEGFQFVVGMSFEQLSDLFAEPLVKLTMESRRVDAHLDRMNEEIKTGLTCHKCLGIGTVEVGRAYVRDGRHVTPVLKTENCTLCEGSGRLRLNC